MATIDLFQKTYYQVLPYYKESIEDIFIEHTTNWAEAMAPLTGVTQIVNGDKVKIVCTVNGIGHELPDVKTSFRVRVTEANAQTLKYTTPVFTVFANKDKNAADNVTVVSQFTSDTIIDNPVFHIDWKTDDGKAVILTNNKGNALIGLSVEVYK